MALIAISGHPGCRFEDVARITAQRLGFELLTQARLEALAAEEFGAETRIPDKAWASLATSVLARMATAHKTVYLLAGADPRIPNKAWPSLATSVLARLATAHNIVYCAAGGELQSQHFPGMLRVHVVAPENVRIGNIMLDCRLERAAARQRLLELEAADRATRKARVGKPRSTADLFDLLLNAETVSGEQMAELIDRASATLALTERIGRASCRERG